MPSKFKKAIAAVKDQTSISLAKVGGADSSSLEVAILKATTHDEVPVDERHVTEVLQHVSSNRSYAGSCARAIGRRIGRTKNWVVAVKSLMLILRIFQDGDPHFPKEVLHAMKRGYKILNLSSFRDESTTSCPWDFTAFVRTFALYLDERLDCFLTGKLNRRTSHHPSGKTRGYSRKNVPIVRDMKPGVLLDRISHWQRLLDRAIATRPTGAAKGNRLVQTCLYAIVQETFELYRDISDGLALLLDSFFHLQYNNCVSAYHTCVRASKQFEELNFFYDLCKKIGVGRTSEFPSVQKISDELVETLQEFLKDQSSFPGTNGRTPGISTSLPPLSPKESESGSVRRSDLVERDRSMSEFGGSQCTSLEDLIGADPGFSPDRYSDPGREYPTENGESFFNANDTASVRSDPTDHRGISSVLDLLSLDGPSPPPELQVTGTDDGFESDNRAVSATSPRQEGWELVLFDSTDQQHSPQPSNNNNASFEVDFFSSINANAVSPSPSTSTLPVENNYSNPFLEDTIADLNGISGAQPHEGDFFGPSAHASFGASFAEGGFPGDLGLDIVGGDSTVPTFQADFGDSSLNNGMDDFSGGFPTDMGISRANSAPTMFKADFGDDFGTVNANNANFPADFPAVLPTDFDSGNISFAAPATFQAEVSSSHSNGHIISQQSLPIDLFGDFSNASAPKPHHARFSSDSFSPAFAFSDNFPDHNAAVPSVSPSGYSNGIVSDGIENSLSAIVPFNQPSNDDFFSTGPKFQAAPTFRANSIDMDQEELPHSSFLGFENDPFGTLTVANPAVEQQQQLWLQNQNKIMARHNDIAHC